MTLLSSLRKSISELSESDQATLITTIRKDRRSRPPKKKETKPKKEKVSSSSPSPSFELNLSQLSPGEIASLLKQMEEL